MRTTMILAVAFLVAACGPNSGRNGPNGNKDGGHAGDGGNNPNPTGGPTFGSMCNGTPTTISGSVIAPNAIDPVANAFVYVPVSVGNFPDGVACDLCGMPVDGASVEAVSSDGTGPNMSVPVGQFTLDLSPLPPSSQVRFTVNKGRFRRSMMLTVTPCMDNNIGAPYTQLPGKAAAGVDDIPKIAVSTGNKDQLDAVLAAMGLDTSVGFDCFEGRKTSTTALMSPCGKKTGIPAIETLLKDSAMLDKYNILFLSCAPGKFASLPAADQMTIATNLRDWTGKGGRVFATDNSYDYIAQAFPMDVMFMNGNTTVDQANVGVGGSSTMPTQYMGKVNDATLRAWLTAVNAITGSSNMLTLDGYLNKWSVIQSVPATTTDLVDATNGVAYTAVGGTTAGPAMSYPQTVRFDVTPPGGTAACGRAIYTSYHTLPATMAVDATHLAPQERILEYLMLEAGACVGSIN